MTIETRINKDRLSPYDYVIRGKKVPEELEEIALNELKILPGSKHSPADKSNNSESKELFPGLAGKNNNPWYK